MPSAIQEIQDGIEWHKTLIGILTETDYAHGALRQQNNYIGELDRSINEKRRKIQELDTQREKELKEHESYRDSKVKKLAFRVSGKSEQFAARAEKEQQEYYQVLQDLKTAGDEEQDLKSRRSQALGLRNDYETAASRNKQAQHDIEALYDKIFSVHGHLFPHPEQARIRYADAAHNLDMITQKVNAEEQASQTLSSATVSLQKASSHMESALDHSRMDIMGGGSMSDYLERRDLDKTEAYINEANSKVRQAQQICPQIESLPPVRIPGPSMGDIVFDNIFSDLDMHDRIKGAREQLRRSAHVLDVQLKYSNNRRAVSESEQQLLSQNCTMAKTEMLKARRAAFEGAAMSGDIIPTTPPSSSSAAPAVLLAEPWSTPYASSTSSSSTALPSYQERPQVPGKSNNPFLGRNQINGGHGGAAAAGSSSTSRSRSSSSANGYNNNNENNNYGGNGNNDPPPPYPGLISQCR